MFNPEPPDISYDDARRHLWDAGDLSYLLWPQQVPIYDQIKALPSHVTEIVNLLSRQMGKSFMACLMATEDALTEDDCCVPIFGPTIEQCAEIVNPRMEYIKKRCPYTNAINRHKSEGKWYVGNSEIVIGGFDFNTSSRRGMTVRRNVYIEEVVDSNPDSFMSSMRSDIGPALTHSKTGKILYMTTLPKTPDHPFITEIIPRAKLDGAFFVRTIHDNTVLTLQQFIRCAKLAGCRVADDGTILQDTVDWRREYLCEIVRDASVTVVPQFDRMFHVKQFEKPPHCKWQVTIDFGGVRDLTVAIYHTYDYQANRHLVFDELMFKANTPTKTIMEAIKKWKCDDIVADCPGQIQVDLAEAGCMVRPPPKDDWLAGINQLNVMFLNDRIHIMPCCKFLIASLDSGQFNANKTDYARTTVLGHCDAIAALNYAMRSANTDDPFPITYGPNQHRFAKPIDSRNGDDIGYFIQPKLLGNSKAGRLPRLGSFKK